jgi:hypothetical protein
MLGMLALIGAYYFTGQIVPGIFWGEDYQVFFGGLEIFSPFLFND